jgi:hypothetical protein
MTLEITVADFFSCGKEKKQAGAEHEEKDVYFQARPRTSAQVPT